jgi:hypothetical protein
MSNNYEITEHVANDKKYYLNPITKRNILKNNRNLISIQKQIKTYLLKHPPTEEDDEEKEEIKTHLQITEPTPTEEQPTADQSTTTEIKEAFKAYKIDDNEIKCFTSHILFIKNNLLKCVWTEDEAEKNKLLNLIIVDIDEADKLINFLIDKYDIKHMDNQTIKNIYKRYIEDYHALNEQTPNTPTEEDEEKEEIKTHLQITEPTPTEQQTTKNPNPVDDITQEIKTAFKNYKPNTTALNNYIKKILYAFNNIQILNTEIYETIDTASQMDFIERLNYITRELKDAMKSITKLMLKNDVKKEDRADIIKTYTTHTNNHRDLIRRVESLKRYPSQEEADEAIRQTEQNRQAHQINRLRQIAFKKINNLYNNEIAKWIKYKMEKNGEKSQYGTTLNLSSATITNMDIDYNFIKSQCISDIEKEVFKIYYAKRMEQTEQRRADETIEE